MAISPMITPRSWMLALARVASVTGLAIADDNARKQAQSQVEFGIAVAQRGLWQEAVFRWERAAEIDVDRAMKARERAQARFANIQENARPRQA